MPIIMRRSPFSSEIQPGALYAAESFKEAQRRLHFLVENRGIGVLTGAIGVGKTTAVRAFTTKLAAGSFLPLYTVPPMARSPLRPVVEDLLTQLGEPLPFNNTAKGLHLLKDALAACYERNCLPFLIIDDATLLEARALLLLKVLTNYEMDSKLPICLLLVGSPLLTRYLATRELEEIRQRLLFAYQVRGLRREEVEDYIKARLRAGGYDTPIFPRDVIEELFFHSQGNPRTLNQMASLCMMAAAAERKDLVDRSCLMQAVAEVTATGTMPTNERDASQTSTLEAERRA
jgi:type II secretory pathway predicted ATPase ExeA